MYVITNRQIRSRRSGLEIFGDKPNTQKGPKELRIVKCEFTDDSWETELLPDRATGDRLKELRRTLKLPVSDRSVVYTSVDIAERVISEARRSNKNILLFVHGYNNKVGDALNRAKQLQEDFNVIPVIFSWPANGGGARGTLSYLSDKQDAQCSTPAFSRVLEKVSALMIKFTKLALEEIKSELEQGMDEDELRGSDYYAKRNEMLEGYCPVRLTLLTHSMGNYLLKKTIETHFNAGFTSAFDNVLLVAADTNNYKHEEWVDKIGARRRVYITINENDYALAASRIKPGEEQKARLGHYRRRLNSEIARYIDFTDASDVGNSHSYFAEQALQNDRVRTFFDKALNGEEAESGVEYSVANNVYRIG